MKKHRTEHKKGNTGEKSKLEIPTDEDVKKFSGKGSMARESAAEPDTVTGDQYPGKEPEQEVSARLEKELEAQKDRFLRLAAEFDNFKKRSARETDDRILRREAHFFRSILPVLDSFHEGCKSVADDPKDEVGKGFRMIHKLLNDTLREMGLEEIDDRGKKFDPYLHEVITMQPDGDMEPEHVLQTLQKGYRYRSQLMRPAKVILSSAVPPEESDPSLTAVKEQPQGGNSEDSKEAGS